MDEEIQKTTDTDLIACLADEYGFSISNLEMFNNDSNKYTKIPKEKPTLSIPLFSKCLFLQSKPLILKPCQAYIVFRLTRD